MRTVKYAIYKNKIGLSAVELLETPEDAKQYPYIHNEQLPVLINRMGGFNSFDLEYEKAKGFTNIIEVPQDEEPLTLEEMYPKNDSGFEYGWISPEGDTYRSGYKAYDHSAECICRELGLKDYNAQKRLNELGWIFVTAIYENKELVKTVWNMLAINQKQVETLKRVGMGDSEAVSYYNFVNKDKNDTVKFEIDIQTVDELAIGLESIIINDCSFDDLDEALQETLNDFRVQLFHAVSQNKTTDTL